MMKENEMFDEVWANFESTNDINQTPYDLCKDFYEWLKKKDFLW